MNSLIVRRVVALRYPVTCVSVVHQLRSGERPCTYKVEVDSGGLRVAMVPDMIKDTPAINPALRIPQGTTNPIPFDQLTPETVFRALLKNSIVLTASIEELSTESVRENITLPQLIEAIQVPIAALDFSVNLLRILTYNNTSQYPMDALVDISDSVDRISRKRLTPLLYQLIERFRERQDLSDDEKLLLRLYSQLCERTGCNLENPKKRQIAREDYLAICDHRATFLENCLGIERLTISVTEEEVIKTLPEALLRENVDAKGLKLPPYPYIYEAFIRTCPKRSLRHRFWYAFNNVGSADPKKSNSSILDEIRDYRQNMAKTCGYPNYVEMTIGDKMVGSVEAAREMLQMLIKEIRPRYEKDLKTLEEFRKELHPDDTGPIELWDIKYLKSMAVQSKVGKIELSRYLTLKRVLNGLFEWLRETFNVSIKELECKSTLGQSTSLYQVFDEDLKKVVGHFYFQPFATEKLHVYGPQVFEVTSRCQITGTSPLSYFMLNKRAPAILGGEIVLNYDEFISIAYGIGKVLSSVLNQRPYHDLSRSERLGPDRSYWFPSMLASFAKNDYRLMEKCTLDRTKKAPLSLERFEILRKSTISLNSIAIVEALFFSALDLALHINNEYWRDVMTVIWEEYMAPFEVPKDYNYPLSFRELVSEQFAASYFCRIWSQMIADDCYMKFKTDEQKGKSLQEVGRQFKESVLYVSAPLNGAEVYRRFMGRDPAIDAFLELNGLVLDSNNQMASLSQS
ncbi:oligopeptidase A [Brevipalpus obovatus]|uniref:oligopeptidase A n=1 Tax=Brevipalpus obovatus TaxID=246614 RepID=UPI003D9E77F2